MTSESRPTIIIVDDSSETCGILTRILEDQGFHVQTFGHPKAFLEEAALETAVTLIFDLRMPEIDGMTLFQTVRERGCQTPVIMISGYADVPVAVDAVKAGTFDFIEKPIDRERFLNAVDRALMQNAQQRADRTRHSDLCRRFQRLTPRETEVMQQLVNGRANKEIAAAFGVSTQAIDAHRKRILRKLEVENVTELAWLASEMGMQSPLTIRYADTGK
jgi:FixJ family two-component response regulator